MKSLIVFLILCATSFAWNCPAGQIRTQAPAGTSTTTPYYDVVEGIAFICTSSTPSTGAGTQTQTQTQTSTNTNNVSGGNSNSSASLSNSGNSNSSASLSNSGNSTSTVRDSGNSSNTNIAAGGSATLRDSGNSSNTNRNTNVATGGQGGKGGSASGWASASDNGNGSNNTVTNVAAPKIPVSTAVTPPIMPTVPCFKGMGGSVQTMAFGGSFGGGKVDQGCDDRELARAFSGPQTIASCKVLINTKKAKKAGITMEDCLYVQPVAVAAVIPEVREARMEAPVAPSSVIILPIEVLTLPALTPVATTMDVQPLPPVVKKRRPVRHLPPGCQNVVTLKCAETKEK